MGECRGSLSCPECGLEPEQQSCSIRVIGASVGLLSEIFTFQRFSHASFAQLKKKDKPRRRGSPEPPWKSAASRGRASGVRPFANQ